MTADQLRALQTPLKARYREDPAAARVTHAARGRLDQDGVACHVKTWHGTVDAGLHPAAGGDGSLACSGDMLLEALVACAGVTLKAVATALAIPLRGGEVVAEGEVDFRGTLGVDKSAPVGFADIRLRFVLDTDAPPEQVQKLIALTERYCVIYQTLRSPPPVTVTSGPGPG
jgi:uncharacterized OsmC-like protein